MFSSLVRAVRPLAIASAAVALTAVSLPAQTTAVAPSRILAPVDDAARVTLHGYVSPLARAANDRGPAPDSMPLERMHLVLAHSPAQQAALEQFLSDVHNPSSASYHKWLTPAQFGAQFGPSDQDVATVESWLSAHGFEIDGVKPGKQVLEFTGSVAQFREAFGAQIHQYVVNGHTGYATAGDPSIPAALAPVVSGFASLNDFHPQTHARVLGTASFDPKTGQSTPNSANWTYGNSAGVNFVLAPADFGVEYDIPNAALNSKFAGTTLDGTGQSIAILDFSNIDVTLANEYRTLFGLPANPPTVIVDGNDPGIDGINNPEGPDYGTSFESYLDVEQAGAIAPKATIDLVIAADTALEYGGFLAAERAVESNVAPVISSSIDLGGCEQAAGYYNSFIDSLWQQAAAQGITVVIAAGDSGSAGCDSSGEEFATLGLGMNNWATTPYDIAVGGTDFYYSDYNQGTTAVNGQLATYWSTTATQNPAASIKGYVPEQPWNDSQYGLNILNYYSVTGATTIAAGSGGPSSAAVCAAGYNSSTGVCSGTPTGYPKPSWQSGVTGIPADGFRDTPDVSLFAADGLNASYYAICASDGDCAQAPSGSNLWQITGVGGTSAAAPSFAAIMALVNEKYGPQGQANYILYALKANSGTAASFHDITVGTNAVPCASGSPNCITVANPITVEAENSAGALVKVTEGEIGTGTTPDYNAGAGYNLATGLGSVDAAQLISNWGSVKFTSSGVDLTSPTANSTYTHGTPVSFSGSVSGSTTPTGNVAIMTNSSAISNQGVTNFALNGGAFGGSISYLPGGTYDVWASYAGDAKNAASTSTPISITVNPEPSAVVLSPQNIAGQALGSGVSLSYGSQILLDAQVYGSNYYTQCNVTNPPASCQGYTNATGTIAFKDGSSTLSTALLNSESSAEFNAPLAVGTHSITANYAGDVSYQAGSSSPFTVTITKNTPTIQLGTSYFTSSGALPSGQANVLTIVVLSTANLAGVSSSGPYTLTGGPYTVAVAPPTGTVTLSGGPSGMPTSATLVAAVDPNTGEPEGIATITIPSTSSTFNLGVTYNGDSNYNSVVDTGSNGYQIPYASTGGTASSTTATVTGSISPTTTVTITGTVSGAVGKAAPTGTVELYAGGYILTEASLTAATASLDRQPLDRFNDRFHRFAAGGGAVLACVLLLAIPARRRAWRNFLALVVVACIAAFDIGCGGSNGGGGSGSGGGGTGGGGGSSAPYANFSFVLNSESLLQGSNTITVQYEGDSNYAPSAFTITNPLANPLSDFTLTAANGIVPITLGSGTTSVYVTPTNGFAGTVNLACSVNGSPSGVSCSLSQSSVSASSPQTVTLTVNAAGSAAMANDVVTVTGASGSQIHTLGVMVPVP